MIFLHNKCFTWHRSSNHILLHDEPGCCIHVRTVLNRGNLRKTYKTVPNLERNNFGYGKDFVDDVI